MSQPVIYWYRQDLRLTDLAGLHAATAAGPVIPVFVWDPDLGEDWRMGGASQWWLHHSLEHLTRALETLGSRLILRQGNTLDVLGETLAETGAQGIFASRQYDPWSDDLERQVRALTESHGATFKRFPGTLLFEPGSITTGAGTPFKVFTPFWRACLKAANVSPPLPVPELPCPDAWPDSADLDALGLLPTSPNWAEGWESIWEPGETGAAEALDHFLGGAVEHYGEGRDMPAQRYTSRLSPHLKFGEISPRQVWWATHNATAEQPHLGQAADKFLSEIGWREFCKHLVDQFPAMADQAFNGKFDRFPWQHNENFLRAWQRGQTGYPIVDAGMRELWQTGFMHNRVRMIVASFLTKHLLVHWREGERWFWDCLLDADLGSNACSWQWVAGSGADASPYFRIFNPVAQGEKFDKAGEYTRHWVPELAELPNKYLHKPWEAPAMTLAAAGITLGETYPAPIVDHKAARAGALDAYATLKAIA